MSTRLICWDSRYHILSLGKMPVRVHSFCMSKNGGMSILDESSFSRLVLSDTVSTVMLEGIVSVIEMVRMSDGSSMYVGPSSITFIEVGGCSIAAAGTTWWSLSSLQSGILDLLVL